MQRIGTGLWRLGVGGVFALITLPTVVVLWLSFFDQQVLSFPPTGYTLRWYANAWSRPEFARGFVTSAWVAVVATILGVSFGTAAALALVRGRLRGRGAIASLLLGPLAVPGIVLGTAIYVMFVRLDDALDLPIVATLPGLIAAHAMLTIPWTVRLVAASLEGMPLGAEEAAANLGARPFTVFRRVTLPLMRSGVVAGALFSFIQSFENLELSLFLTGPGRITLPVAMLNYLEYRIDPTLAAVAAMQIVMLGVLMLVTDRFVSLSRVVS